MSSIREVAQKAGVSVSTVSKALNGKGAISEEKIKHIRKVANDLGYHPNLRAQNFARKKTNAIIFLAKFPYDAAFVNPHMFEIMRGAEHALSEKGYHLIVKESDEKRALLFMESTIQNRMADGIIFHASVINRTLAKKIEESKFPHIVIGKPDFSSRLCWVDTNNEISGELAVTHLLERGYRDIAFLGGGAEDMTSWHRLHGVRSMLAEHNLSLQTHFVIQTRSNVLDAYKASMKLLKLKPLPQAVICANNLIAMGFVQAMQTLKLKIPDAVAVLTFDTYPLSLCTVPLLTVVDVNMYDMGQEVGRLICQQIKRPTTLVQSHTTLPILIKRDST